MRAALGLLALLLAAGCDSPEATRTRGGGPGGDTGNRPPLVRMHEGSRPYHEQPRLVPGPAPSLDGAAHARRHGRPP